MCLLSVNEQLSSTTVLSLAQVIDGMKSLVEQSEAKVASCALSSAVVHWKALLAISWQ